MRTRTATRCLARTVAGVLAGAAMISTSVVEATPSQASIPSGPITFGITVTLSGPTGPSGQGIANEYQAAAAYVNKYYGGIDGHKISLNTLNDQANPAIAAQNARSMVGSVDAVVEEGYSGINSSTIPIFQKAHIPIVGTDPNDEIAKGSASPYLYTVNYTYAQTGQELASYAKKTGIKSVGIISDGTTIAQSYTTDLDAALKKVGVHVDSTQTYSPTAVDVTTQVNALKAANPQALVVLGVSNYGVIYQALHTAGWSPKILETAVGLLDGESQAESLNLASNMALACGNSIPSTGTLDPEATKVMTYMSGQPEATANLHNALLAVDTLLILRYAIQKSNSVSGPAVVKNINSISKRSFSSPAYPWTFTTANHAGYEQTNVHMCTLAPGKFGLPVRIAGY